MTADVDIAAVVDHTPTDGWTDHAACRGHTGTFFSERGNNAKVAEARNICATCPVTLDCLAVGLGEKHGIWGGTSEGERRQLRRQALRLGWQAPTYPGALPSIITGARGTREQTWEHGTITGYMNHACRCNACRDAGSAYFRARRARLAS